MRELYLVLVAVFLFGQSSSPPRKRIPVDDAVSGANGTKNGAPKEDRGVPQTPSITGAATPQGSDAAQEPAQSSPDSEVPHVTSPDPVVRYTFWLVIVGALQFAALIIQAVFLYRAFEETTKATGLTSKALAEAQRSNTASEALTRESLVLSHPPRIVVRNIEMDDMIFRFRGIPGGPQGPIPATGTARLFNKGGSTAHVTAWCCHVFLYEVLPMKLPFGQPEIAPERPVDLPAGKFGTMPFPTTQRDSITIPELFQIANGPVGIYVMGVIVYGDDFGNLRTTSFCREWRRGQQRFEPVVDNPDYEDTE
jgi:hypothetical protein